VALAAMAVTPFVLIALQSYGGEIFLRCFLYAMPFLAVLGAVALSPVFRLPDPGRALAIAGVTFLVALALVTTRGVNVAFERTSPDALAAARMITAAARTSPKVAVVESFTPLSQAAIERQRVTPLGVDCEVRLVECVVTKRPDLILLTREQEQYGRLRRQLPDGWLMQAGRDQLVARAGYHIVFRRANAVVLQRDSMTSEVVK
jgi:hypothetical protein